MVRMIRFIEIIVYTIFIFEKCSIKTNTNFCLRLLWSRGKAPFSVFAYDAFDQWTAMHYFQFSVK